MKRLALPLAIVLCLLAATFQESPATAQEIAPSPLADANLDLDPQHEISLREADDERLRQAAADAELRFSKITVPNRMDDLKIPLYIFEPLNTPGKSALVWVYGGIHDRFGVNYFPFIREAVERGFTVVAPEYRGARGYGEAFYQALDYGGREVTDILAAADEAARRVQPPHHVSILGWSHGGLIALLAAARHSGRYERVVASVPVTDLVSRMAYKGPEYQALFSRMPGIGGPVDERPATYIARSPLYQVEHLRSRVMVQLATNDNDVRYSESEPLVEALRAELGERAEVIVFEDPPHGHYFNRQVDLETLERQDTPAQVRSWDAIWSFLDPSPEGGGSDSNLP